VAQVDRFAQYGLGFHPMRAIAAAPLVLIVGLTGASAAQPAGPLSVAMADSPPSIPPTSVMTSEVQVPSPKVSVVRRQSVRVRHTGRERSFPVAATRVGAPPADLLDRLAHCESGMRQDAVNPRGPYLSYFQMLPATSRALGLGSDPRNHSYEAQKAAVAQIDLSRWRVQFPGCSRKLGVR
jgi:hypothetical protein